MIVLIIAFSVIMVFYYIKRIDMNHKIQNYRFIKEITDFENMCDRLSKLSEEELDKLLFDFEENLRIKKEKLR